MKIARNILIASFIVYIVTSLVITVADAYHDVYVDFSRDNEGDVHQFFPFLIARMILAVGVFTIENYYNLRGVIVFLLALLSPIVGCCFIKKPIIYRFIVYPATFLMIALDVSMLIPDQSLWYLGDVLCILWVIAIDVVNSVLIKREKRRDAVIEDVDTLECVAEESAPEVRDGNR